MDEETRDQTAGAQSGGSGVGGQESHGDARIRSQGSGRVRDGTQGAGAALAAAAPAAAAAAPPAPGLEPNVSAATLAVVQELVSQGSALLTAQREAVLDNRLAASGLPVALQESVRGDAAGGLAGWGPGSPDRGSAQPVGGAGGGAHGAGA